jgi:chromosome segregation ATPase
LVQELEIANARAEAAEKLARETEHLHKCAVDALKKVEVELQEAKSELAESHLLIKSESERVQVHSQLLEDKEDDASRLTAEVAKLKAQIADMEEHVREAVDKDMELKKLHESLLSGNEEVSMLRDELQESQKKYEHALAIQRAKESELSNFESRNRELEQQMENMHHEVEASQEKLQEFERKIVETDIRMSDLRSQAREYELEAKDAKRNAEETRKECDNLKEELLELQKQVSGGMMLTGDGEAESAVSADAEQELLQKISDLESEVSKKDEELMAAKDEVKVERRRASAAAMKAAGIEDISQAEEEKLVIDSEESTDSVVNNLITSIFAKYKN